jgi:o-succinylbenzoate---CoA ligase
MLVDGWLGRAAAARPEHTALLTPGGSWTYSQLHRAALAAAAQLGERGAGRGTRVAIALPPGLAFAQALHGCLLLGAVAVPIDTRLPAGARAHLTAGADVLVEEPLDPAAGSRERRVRHELDDPAVVIHTSGTSAAPKAVTLTYGNLLWSALGSAVALGCEPGERWLCALPLAHVGGLSILLRSAIYATTAVVHERFEEDRVLHALRAGDVTLVSLVAATLARLLDAGLRQPGSLRCALTGGGPVPAALLDRAYAARVPVSITYGLTEASSQVTTTPAAELSRGPALPGPALFCTRVRIAADGEILVAGPTVAREQLQPDGWLHTRDLGALDQDGRLRVTGRSSEVIISGGHNVSPLEVEAVLEEHPAVVEAAVTGREDERWGEAVTAWVVLAPDAAVQGAELLEHCRHRLAPYKVPKEIVPADAPLPRTPSGKLLRRELA